MTFLSIIGTIVFVAVVLLSLLAVMDVLIFKSDKRKLRKTHARAQRPGGRRIWSRK